MKPHSEIDQLLKAVAASQEVLQPEAFQLVREFIGQTQTSTGAFSDRGGQPDWYYSFFGFMLSKAFNLQPELDKLNDFVLHSKGKHLHNMIDWAVWVLLRYSFKPGLGFKIHISLKLVFRWLFKRQKGDQVYLAFLSLLILNHFWGWSQCISRRIDNITRGFLLNEHSPTSHIAAALCIRNHANLSTDELAALLMKNAHREGGFKSFGDHATADMLSTAVAVYALKQIAADIPEIKADGLRFVSAHFENGAFLSGDGDQTRDIEYTFYGLLALSSYAQYATNK